MKEVRELESEGQLMGALATCHSLITIGGELNGDPLDLKMFRSTGWEMEEPGEDKEKYDKMVTAVVKPPSPLDEEVTEAVTPGQDHGGHPGGGGH